MMRPVVATIWRFIGPGVGVGALHKVIFSELEEVVTIGTNHSWLGTAEEFAAQFQFVPTAQTGA